MFVVVFVFEDDTKIKTRNSAMVNGDDNDDDADERNLGWCWSRRWVGGRRAGVGETMCGLVQTRLGATMGGAITLPHSEPVIIIVAVIAVTISVKT